ncbi:MAG: signal recognition particle protein [candidate division Zixibacteria bacterium RBG_16_43_9]|nr:MAG: signal recognition particle protein [candidate division Zixibacteria bacterium RBG_16_43_9]
MFAELSDRLESILKKLRGQGKLTENNIKEALKEVRRALLEADVNYKVVKDFISKVEEKSIGQEVLRSITPGQQVVKIVYDELTLLLGKDSSVMKFSSSGPTVWMLAGLQGSGKTTACGKLASFYRKKGKSPFLIAADVQRPAAVEQLKILGKSLNLPVYSSKENPVKICQSGVAKAREEGLDLVIIDTAGRLHIDKKLMEELALIKKEVTPQEVILVADSMTGQDAVNIALSFEERLGIDGIFLTKLDGDARGGAALSLRAVTGKPIKFVGTGEKLDAIEVFYPERMVSRILGMGDVVTLVEKAQEAISQEEAEKLEKRLREEQFSFKDFYSQLQQLKKMGSLDSILSMIPGIGGSLKGFSVDDKALVRVEAIINSMTEEERLKPQIIDGSRKKRIALGSGTDLQEVNRLLKQFFMMKKMIKDFNKMDLRKLKTMFKP